MSLWSRVRGLLRATPGGEGGWNIVAGNQPTEFQRTGAEVRRSGWERNGVVQGCARAIVDVVAAVDLEVTRPLSDGTMKVIPGHPAAVLLNTEPRLGVTGHTLRAQTALYYLLYGNAFWVLERHPDRRIRAIRLIHPERITYAYLNQADQIVRYDWRDVQGQTHETAADDMLHLRDLAAAPDALFGFPRAAAVLTDMAIDAEASAYVRQVVTNHGYAAAVVTAKGYTNKEELLRAEESFNQRLAGSGRRGRSIFVNGEDVTYTPIGFNLTQLEFPDLRAIAREDICVVPGTLVHTDQGLRPIEAVKVGDRVLTHRGRFRPVRETMTHPHTGEIRRLRAKGLDAVRCTPNHPWLADYAKPVGQQNRTARTVPAEWLPAEALIPRATGATGYYRRGGSHRLTMPHLGTDTGQIDLTRIYAGVLQVDGPRIRPDNPRGTWVPRHVGLTHEFGWLLGLYLAEGAVGHNCAVWNLAQTEDALAERAVGALAILGVTATRRTTAPTQTVTAHSQILRAVFASCGASSVTKAIPDWAMTGPTAFRRGLLEGYVAGDGSRDGPRVRISTVSTSLAAQIRLLVWTHRLHGAASVGTRTTWSIEGRTGVAHAATSVAWVEHRVRAGTGYAEDGYSAFPLAENTVESYDGPVHNLAVEEDESYVTIGGTVHNCTAFAVDPRIVGVGSASANSGGFSGLQFEEARFRLIQQAVLPIMKAFEAELNRWFMPEFGTGVIRFRPDALAELTENEQQTSTRVIAEVLAGIRTVEEARESVGLTAAIALDHYFGGGNKTLVSVALAQGALDPVEKARAMQEVLPNVPLPGDQGPAPTPRDQTTPLTPGATPPARRLPAGPHLLPPSVHRIALLSEPERTAYWRAFDVRAQNEEPTFRKKLEDLFGATWLQLAALFGGLAASRVFDVAAEALLREQVRLLYAADGALAAAWAEALRGPLRDAVMSGAHQAITQGPPGAASLPVAQLIAGARHRAAELSTHILETTYEQIRGLLFAAQTQGMTIRETAGLIRETVFGPALDARAANIARSEIAGAINQGSYLAAVQGRAVQAKMWVSQRDDRVRPSHVHTEAQGWIPVEKAFANGLQYPGDPMGGPEEVINCRCTLAFSDDSLGGQHAA
jgi:HK97 family phage portal protein